MPDIAVYREYGEELERRLRLKTFPLALKLLESEEDIPDEALRPLSDLGHHLSLCQGYQLSRRNGSSVAMTMEDMWCFEPVVGYGLGEPPDGFLEGHNRYPRDVETLQAGENYATTFPRFETGKYIGIVTAPLTSTTFEPDVVVVYCDSSQLSLLLLGREYKEGFDLKCPLSSHASCVYAVVPAIVNGDFQVAVPCRGDRAHAMAGDDEMIFTIPRDKLADLLAGLEHVETTGSKLPRGYSSRPEYPLPEAYARMGKSMGYLE